jgi:hypothetical protein
MYFSSGYDHSSDFYKVNKIKKSIEKIFSNYTNSKKNFDQSVIDLYKNDIKGFIGCAKISQMIPELFSLASSKKMMSKLKSLGLKNPVLNTRPLLSFSCKNTAKNTDYWKIPAHQDWPSMQGSLNSIVCWMPLVDVDMELGPLEVCPGSHLNGPLEHTEIGPHDISGVPILQSNYPEENFVSIPMKKNDALFFSSFLVHRSGVNLCENKIRLSMHIRFDDADEETFIQRKYPFHKIESRAFGNTLPNSDFPLDKYQKLFLLNGSDVVAKQ